jgi:hypothetical protein
MDNNFTVKRSDKRLTLVYRDSLWQECTFPSKCIKFDAASLADHLWRWRTYGDQRTREPVCLSEMEFSMTDMSSKSRLDLYELDVENKRMVGYEIKKSRSDFKSDVKWKNYLKYCTHFYFVCPVGLIGHSEVDDKAGLLTVVPKVFFFKDAQESEVILDVREEKKAPQLQEFPLITDIKDSFMFRVMWMMLKRMNARYLNSRKVIFAQTETAKRLYSDLGNKVYDEGGSNARCRAGAV